MYTEITKTYRHDKRTGTHTITESVRRGHYERTYNESTKRFNTKNIIDSYETTETVINERDWRELNGECTSMKDVMDCYNEFRRFGNYED